MTNGPYNLKQLRKQSAALHFTPQPPVQWMAPRQLLQTVARVFISSLFGAYADKREAQVAFSEAELYSWDGPPAPMPQPGQQPQPVKDSPAEWWLDYTADVGDGFDATFSVAWLMGHQLQVPGTAVPTLPHGELLVLGGDEVYPTASTVNCEDRTKYVYGAVPDNGPPRQLFALPGNHDWYDGLTAFLRIFAARRKIGPWQTQQKRSYFAVRLPHNWWLFGVDSMFGTYVDEPQLEYFRRVPLVKGDGVIVCSATPTWVHTDSDVDAFNSLHYLDRQVVRKKEASIRLWLTGDSHHYARYQELGAVQPHARQMVTCGLGGAFLSATHDLPPALHLPPSGSRLIVRDEPPRVFTLGSRYPDEDLSKKLSRRLLFRNNVVRRNTPFLVLAGLVQVALMLMLIASLPGHLSDLRNHSSGLVWQVGWHRMAAVGLLSAAIGLWAGRGWRGRVLAGVGLALELAVQVGLAVAALLAAACMPWPHPPWDVPEALALLVLWGAAGGVLATQAFILLVLARPAKQLGGLRMSAQGIDDHKGFLRLRVDASGVTVFPLRVENVCRRWRTDDKTIENVQIKVPAPYDSSLLGSVRLIEPAFTISRS